MKEKIEQYLEIVNQSAPNHEQQATMREARRQEEAEEDDLEDEDLEEDDEEEKEEIPQKKIWKRRKKKKSVIDDEIIEDPSDLTVVNGTRIEPLAKQKRQPAQEKAYKELSSINERLASLVQVKQMGLATEENRKQLKQLMKDRKKKAFELRRLQSKQRASNKYRNKRRKIVRLSLLFSLRLTLISVHRWNISLKRSRNYILNWINYIVVVVADLASKNRVPIFCRSSKKSPKSEERAMIGVDRKPSDLVWHSMIYERKSNNGVTTSKEQLFTIGSSSLLSSTEARKRGRETMFRLLPHRASSIDGRRHVHTVPVRLRRAQNDEHGKHEDGHFATATIRYIRDLASIFGNDCVFFLSQDDKCKVPLGLPAARVQAPMLMHLDYRIRLPDHDWTVAPKHQLTPSVYAACLLSKDGDLGYSGPTYVAVRSAKHDQSNAYSHAKDFDRLMQLKIFDQAAKDDTGQVKPIVIITVDGGPDENPRFPKTLVASIRKFKKYNLDAFFVLTHA